MVSPPPLIPLPVPPPLLPCIKTSHGLIYKRVYKRSPEEHYKTMMIVQNLVKCTKSLNILYNLSK